MTSAECVAGTTRHVKPWQGPSTMLSMVSPAAQITCMVHLQLTVHKKGVAIKHTVCQQLLQMNYDISDTQ